MKMYILNTGYLETATISLENPNFAISKNFVKTDGIKSVDYEKNQIDPCKQKYPAESACSLLLPWKGAWA